MMKRHRWIQKACLGTLLGSLSSCASFWQQQPQLPATPEVNTPETVRTETPSPPEFHVSPLPGQLNTKPVLSSNRPELLTTPGLILDSATLGEGLQGEFSAFAHHVVETQPLDFAGFRLGLLARASEKTDLSITKAYFARTRPEALFIETEAHSEHTGTLWSGPGDAMALARLQDSSRPETEALRKIYRLEAQQEQLLFELPVPTNPLGLVGQRNALSLWLDMQADKAVQFRWVALKAVGPGKLKDYQEAAQNIAGPAEPEATNYDPQLPPPRGTFRFGRVSGLVQGDHWEGDYSLQPQDWEHLNAGKALAWPVASTYLKQWGSGQNQSAPLLRKVAGSAVESHGNYGTYYQVRYRLRNPESTPITLHWRWTQPSAYQASAEPPLSYSPHKQVVFRGTVRVHSPGNEPRWIHLQTRQGVWQAPFYTQTLAAGEIQEVAFAWVYPPDAIPPQLLSVEKQP